MKKIFFIVRIALGLALCTPIVPQTIEATFNVNVNVETLQAQTRLYFPASEAAPVSPSFRGNWSNTSEASRFKLANTKGSSAITQGTQIGPWTAGNNTAL